jgi:anaerobic selenocysteine-containing dehydrogenase
VDEYYSDIFENAVPGLPAAAAAAGMSPLDYMRKYGAYAVPYDGQERYARPEKAGDESGDPVGFKTPSRKLEFYSPTMQEWGHGEHALPGYIRSHVHWRNLSSEQMVLLPTFRLPTLIHTRSGNAKWLQEISHTNPLWIHTSDAERLGIANGSLVRVATRIGYFVLRAWVTEGIHPGIVACSHHVGRWRLHKDTGGQRQASARVELVRREGTFLFRQKGGVRPFESVDPDTERIWWKEVGVNQNLTFPVQPDPISGMHCWHQKVLVGSAQPDDRYGDVFVDTNRAREVYTEWLRLTRPAPGPGKLRRPRWFNRPLQPLAKAYKI